MNYLNSFVIAVLLASSLAWMGAFAALLFTRKAGFEARL